MTSSEDKVEIPAATSDQLPNPLREPAFRWYFTGTSISLMGSAMAPVALAFAVLGSTKSILDLGLVMVARTIPSVGFVLVGGVMADRFRRSIVLRFSNSAAALTQGTVAALLLTRNYNLTSIAILEFLNGLVTAFASPAMRGIVPQLVPARSAQKANSLLSSWKNGTRIFGPVVAGLLVATTGGGWAIAVDAMTYIVAAGCMVALRLPQPARGARSTILLDIREGWSEFRRITWIWTVVASFAVTNCLYVGVWNVLGPIIAFHSIGAASWGVVVGARAVGLLVTTALMYRITVRRLLALGQVSIITGAIPLLTLGVYPQTWALTLAAFVAGLGAGIFGPAWDTSLQQHVPNHVLSRVSSYDDLGSFIGVPIGQVVAAPLALVFGKEPVAVASGVLWIAAAVLPLLAASVRSVRCTS